VAYRYLGNKARLAPQLVQVVRSLVPAGSVVADPMCGTASVAAALAAAGYRVIASDELHFPVLHAQARLLLAEVPPFAAFDGGYAGALAELNGLPPAPGLFHREYGSTGAPANGCRPRAYFSSENAAAIDAIRGALRDWRRDGRVTDAEADLLLHDLILAVNDVANIAGTYGYYRSTWNGAALRPLVLRPSEFAPDNRGHRVLQGRVEDLAGELTADLVYLDPPYTKRQYAGNYHILETLAVEDEPEPVGEGGLRDWYGQYSDFCSKRTVRQAFREVLKRVESPHVLISYSEDGLVGPDEMLELLGEFGAVRRHEFALQRFRSNGGKHGAVAEHLYHIARD
jgi:adenine-specific DNA-methyltransferase